MSVKSKAWTVKQTLSHLAVNMYIRSFQSDGDAVEEDENQNDVVEQFVRDHTLAPTT